MLASVAGCVPCTNWRADSVTQEIKQLTTARFAANNVRIAIVRIIWSGWIDYAVKYLSLGWHPCILWRASNKKITSFAGAEDLNITISWLKQSNKALFIDVISIVFPSVLKQPHYLLYDHCSLCYAASLKGAPADLVKGNVCFEVRGSRGVVICEQIKAKGFPS